MNFKFILFAMAFLIRVTCYSQDENITDVTDVTKVTFLPPGISYEKSIGKFQTLYVQGSMNTSFAFSYSSSLGNNVYFNFDPAFALQYRYYYNAVKRQKKGKRTAMNSMNYISPVFEMIFSKGRISSSHYVENNRRPIYDIGVVWGFQRNYQKRFSLDFNLGPGVLFTKVSMPGSNNEIINKNVMKFTTLGQFNLGFWLNRTD